MCGVGWFVLLLLSLFTHLSQLLEDDDPNDGSVWTDQSSVSDAVHVRRGQAKDDRERSADDIESLQTHPDDEGRSDVEGGDDDGGEDYEEDD